MKLRTKIDIALVFLLAIPILGAVVVRRLYSPKFVRFLDADIHRYGRDGREMPSNTNVRFTYRVEGASSFYIDGEHFRLLGIKEPIEEERRQRAVEFVENWLEDARSNVVWFSNWSQALQDDSGTWLVWAEALKGIGGEIHSLNVDLVAAGFADVDYNNHHRYEFRQPEYGGLGPFVKWRKLLDEALRIRPVPNP